MTPVSLLWGLSFDVIAVKAAVIPREHPTALRSYSESVFKDTRKLTHPALKAVLRHEKWLSNQSHPVLNGSILNLSVGSTHVLHLGGDTMGHWTVPSSPLIFFNISHLPSVYVRKEHKITDECKKLKQLRSFYSLRYYKWWGIQTFGFCFMLQLTLNSCQLMS